MLKRLSNQLYFWVLCGVLFGLLLGVYQPEFAVTLKPLGDAFINLIKMLIAPIVFLTVAIGISSARSGEQVGRIGFKSLLYFEVVSTLALLVGLLIASILKPGSLFHVDPKSLDQTAIQNYAEAAKDFNLLGHAIPTTFVDAFTRSGDLTQVLLLGILFGFGLSRLKNRSSPIFTGLKDLSEIFFSIIGFVMKLAPIGAGAAMAFTVGRFGIESLKPLLFLLFSFYLSCFCFVVFVLGLICWTLRIPLFRILLYLKSELITVLATSSSESALAPLMKKLEQLGCSQSIVGLVVPTGYSMNLDGTNIYMTLAALFIAQALGIELSFYQQLSFCGLSMITSKGASGVTGAGFVTLAATLALTNQIPVAGLTLILGVDRFMSEGRALTNMIGNTVATLVISKWEKEFDETALWQTLRS